MIHLRDIKRGKRRDYSYAKCLRAANQPARQHSPSALCVANSDRARELIDGRGQLHAMVQDFVGQSFRNLDAAGSSIMTAVAVGNVGPTLQKSSSTALLFDHVQAALQPYKIT